MSEPQQKTEPPPYKPKPPAPKRARLVVSETVYHATAGGSPTSSTHRYSRTLTTDEQPFRRHFGPTQQWQPLETGWLSAAGLLTLSAVGGTVELGLLVADAEPPGGSRTAWSPPRRTEPLVIDFARVRPGESVRIEPTRLAALRVRYVGEKPAKCVLSLLPE